MEYTVTYRDIADYLERFPDMRVDRSRDLANMVNYFIERYKDKQKDIEHDD